MQRLLDPLFFMPIRPLLPQAPQRYRLAFTSDPQTKGKVNKISSRTISDGVIKNTPAICIDSSRNKILYGRKAFVQAAGFARGTHLGGCHGGKQYPESRGQKTRKLTMANKGKPRDVCSGLAVGTRSGKGHLKAGLRSGCLTRMREEGTRTVVPLCISACRVLSDVNCLLGFVLKSVTHFVLGTSDVGCVVVCRRGAVQLERCRGAVQFERCIKDAGESWRSPAGQHKGRHMPIYVCARHKSRALSAAGQVQVRRVHT